jgi:ABC-type phosphate transport system substrate-binding protein
MKPNKLTLPLFLSCALLFFSFSPSSVIVPKEESSLNSAQALNISKAAPKVEIAIIINAGNPVNKMGADFVKNYWLRRFVKRWKETNKGILPADHKGKSPEQELFYNQVLGLPADAVESYLSARQYQNGDNPPQKFATDADMIAYVSSEVGAIGYVKASSITADESSVKVILHISK